MAEVITVAASKEEWRDVKGWVGYYQVSNRGRVRSRTRVITRSNGQVQTIRERILSQKTNEVNLARPGKVMKCKVHVLVAQAFLTKPYGADRVCHKDDDTTNNKVSNLYWGDASSNGKDAYRNGRHANKVMPKGVDHYKATPVKTINKIRTLHLKGKSYPEIVRLTGTSRDTVMSAVKNKGHFAEVPWPK